MSEALCETVPVAAVLAIGGNSAHDLASRRATLEDMHRVDGDSCAFQGTLHDSHHGEGGKETH